MIERKKHGGASMKLNLIPSPRSVTINDGFAPDVVTQRLDPALAAEAYCLEADASGIRLSAGSDQGLAWAENTLRQLRRQFPEAIPCLTIADEPAYAFRSFHLDSARHFFPMSEMKKIVDMAACFKLNTLHWHFSDDQGWRIESKAFPKLHELGAYRNGELDVTGACTQLQPEIPDLENKRRIFYTP